MKQCALHTAAALLVRESGVLHGVRANAGFDVPLEDSVFLDGVSGNLQVDAGAAPARCVPQSGQRDSAFCETDRLHEVLETEAASSLVAESGRLHDVLETFPASSLVAEIVRLPAVLECSAASSFAETDQLHTESESSGALLGEAEFVGCV